MTTAELYASKLRELLDEAKNAGVHIHASVACDAGRYGHDVFLIIDAGLFKEVISI